MDKLLYQGLLNKIEWEGAKGLWSHGGKEMPRIAPPMFYTVGVPGILVDKNIDPAHIAELEDGFDTLAREWLLLQGFNSEYTPQFPAFPIMMVGLRTVESIQVTKTTGYEAGWTPVPPRSRVRVDILSLVIRDFHRHSHQGVLYAEPFEWDSSISYGPIKPTWTFTDTPRRDPSQDFFKDPVI